MLRYAAVCVVAIAAGFQAPETSAFAEEPARVTEDDVVQWLYLGALTTPDKLPAESRNRPVEELASKYVLDSDLKLDVNKPSLEGKSLTIAQMAAKKRYPLLVDVISAERPLDLASEAHGEDCRLLHLMCLAAPSANWLRRLIGRQEGEFEIVSEPGRDLERFVRLNPSLTDREREEVRELLRSLNESGKIREIRSP